MKEKYVEYSNPVLVEVGEITYKYRLIRDLRIKRKVEDRTAVVPESHAKAVVTAFVETVISKEEPYLRKNYSKILVKVLYEKKNYCIGVVFQINNGLIHISDIRNIPVDTYKEEVLPVLEGETLLMEDVDIEQMIIRMEPEINKHQLFYGTKDMKYRLAFTRHVSERRAGRKNARLTLPTPVIRNIVKFFVKENMTKIEKYMSESINERKVVIVLQDREKEYNIGILVIINVAVPGNIIFIVLTMIDEKPKETHFAKVLFPKVPRLKINDFDLDKEMLDHEKTIPKIRKVTVKKGETRITKVASIDEYYEKHAIKRGRVAEPLSKIKRIKKVDKEKEDTE